MLRYVWQELANPLSAAEKAGGARGYYGTPRPELIALIRGEPRRVLDVGCGGGATGHSIKERFPNARVEGVERNAEAAAIAGDRLDAIHNDNVETIDYAAAGFQPHSIDLVLFPDVLEHLYDPWNVLVRLKPFLAPGAQVLASIPNIRNLCIINELLTGTWKYVDAGLLDVTHIRFFTKKSIIELFDQTGYRIHALQVNLDGRVPDAAVPPGSTTIDVDTNHFTLKHVTEQDLLELRTLQFLVDASPAA